jgi:hypothetical protein
MSNKIFDLIIISFITILVIVLITNLMTNSVFLKFIFKFIVILIIVLFFFYEKTKNVKSNLFLNYQNYFSKIEYIFNNIFNFLGNFFKPFKIGNNVLLDLSQFVFLIILLFLLTI